MNKTMIVSNVDTDEENIQNKAKERLRSFGSRQQDMATLAKLKAKYPESPEQIAKSEFC